MILRRFAFPVQSWGVTQQHQVKLDVEELTLHLIRQEKENKELRERLAQLETRAAESSVPTGC